MSFIIAAFGNCFLGHQLFLCWQLYWLFSFLTSLLHLTLGNIKASLLNTNMTEWEKEREWNREKQSQTDAVSLPSVHHGTSSPVVQPDFLFLQPFPAIDISPRLRMSLFSWFFKLVGSPPDHCYFVNIVIMFIPMTQSKICPCLWSELWLHIANRSL